MVVLSVSQALPFPISELPVSAHLSHRGTQAVLGSPAETRSSGRGGRGQEPSWTSYVRMRGQRRSGFLTEQGDSQRTGTPTAGGSSSQTQAGSEFQGGGARRSSPSPV